jgi:hypothetical protein
VGAFRSDTAPPIPDYADPKAWAALPFQKDSADVVPDTSYRDMQDRAAVDVFFLYPTTYIGKKGQRAWNGDVRDEKLNVRTDRSAIRNQATVFNGSCKVYAPRYRQAHLECFYTLKQKGDAEQALNLAYRDVHAAFEYYLQHYNQGRPLIIASHSQGTMHAARLINEYYREGNDMPPLVVAYLIGMPVKKDNFENLRPCETPDDTDCFCSWRTVDEKYRPKRTYPTGDDYEVTNPLTWTNDVEIVPRSLHKGAVLGKFYHGLYPGLLEARVADGLLRVSRPKIPGAPFLPTRNYHIADYNFFYANIRLNVKNRIDAYFKKAPLSE